jgi:rhodanese-related sulfurtransferase
MHACEIAADEGYDVVNVTGGTGAWIDSGREVVIGDTPSGAPVGGRFSS